ncbi:hypothetical protein [Blastococcus tunisiensis]|uniref:Uncharacterized protein n=1 Tax=Blastococcus tunisiensis TaxID=1798228 RepID=A0A1I2ESW4_9ACTN|nr:hypothetical protein [Blastococcus sp. DSM 46838]SFE95919.1 hypothetical protein SAMN05216574_107175 [Blastococcus sp. DSM 46838]
MATSLQRLLDDVTARAADGSGTPTFTIEDTVGALGHAGRALRRLAGDGLDARAVSRRGRMVAQLGASCQVAGSLWPATGGPLTDLMGAAADLAGRERPPVGRAERRAVCAEFAAAADQCAQLAQRLVPQATVHEFGEVRRLAAAVERDAQANPPGPAAGAVLDRLIPVTRVPVGLTGAQVAAEAAATLVAAIDRADRQGGLALREFRAVAAAAELSTRNIAAVAAALPGGDNGQPWRSAAIAWQVAGRATYLFEDGHRAPRTEVTDWANLIPDALHRDLGTAAGIDAASLRAHGDLRELIPAVQQVANQIPVVADQLAATTLRWAKEGRLSASARDLPQMEDMPEQRIRDVIAGHRVIASGEDFDPLTRSVTRAGSLSTALADALNHAEPAGSPMQPNLAAAYAARTRAPGGTEGLVSQARDVEQAMAANRTPFQSVPRHQEGTAPGV